MYALRNAMIPEIFRFILIQKRKREARVSAPVPRMNLKSILSKSWVVIVYLALVAIYFCRKKIGLTSDLMLKVDTPAIRGDVAVMFAAALDIPLMAQTSWSPDGSTSYVILDGSQGTEKKTLRIMNFEE